MRFSTTMINHRETSRSPRLLRLAPLLILLLVAQFVLSGCRQPPGTVTTAPPGVATVPGEQPSADALEPTSGPGPEATVPPVVEPSPTPQSLVLLVGAEASSGIKGALEAWGQAQGWSVREAPAGAPQDWGDLPGLKAAVSVGLGGSVPGWEVTFPGLPLVLVDQPDVTPGGLVSTVSELGTRHDQAAFLAGVMTGLASRSWVVAYISGEGDQWSAVYRSAFIHGVRYGCPRCGIYETWESVTPEMLRSERVDAFFVAPGGEAAETAVRLADSGLSAVWVGEIPEGVAEEGFAGRVEFAPDVLVVKALEALLAGEAGRVWSYSIEDGGLRVAGLDAEVISPGRQRILQAAWEALASGELEIGVDPTTGQEG